MYILHNIIYYTGSAAGLPGGGSHEGREFTKGALVKGGVAICVLLFYYYC